MCVSWNRLAFQELQAHYDEVQRQLQVTLDQLGISQRRLQSLTSELEEVRGNYESVSTPDCFIVQTYRENVYPRIINNVSSINYTSFIKH